MMLRQLVSGLLFLTVFYPVAVFAQDPAASPTLPDTLQNLAAKGAQIRYLGREKGLDGWIAIHQGQEQYFYATPDREAVLMGLLFDKSGKMLTIRQVQNLQQGNDPTIESLMLESEAAPADPLAAIQAQLQQEQEKTATPSEKLFADIEASNWIRLGNEKAPVIYAFLDPQCPHCHDFMGDIRKDYLDAGLLQLRMIPVGFRDETKIQAALLLAAKNPQELWYRHLDGDEAALPVSSSVNRQAVELNMAMMQDWTLDATPIIVYRSGKGEVKIVRGRPRNPSDILTDLQEK
ncbi:MAG: thioredoxin domain-containing protein [Micavibrio sp.]